MSEDAIRDAAELPAPSRSLRLRVLRAARRARQQQTIRRRVLIAASLLLPMTVLGTWLHNTVNHSVHDRHGVHGAGAIGLPNAAPTPTDDWDRVDALLRERRRHAQSIGVRPE